MCDYVWRRYWDHQWRPRLVTCPEPAVEKVENGANYCRHHSQLFHFDFDGLPPIEDVLPWD